MTGQLENAGLTMSLMHAALAAGTTSTVSTTGTTHYAIRGLTYTKAALTNAATPTVDIVDGLAFTPLIANQATVFVLGYDAGGNLRAGQGSIEPVDSGGNIVRAPQWPNMPDTVCPIGYIIAKAISTLVGTWTFGTNNLSSVTGMSWIFRSVSTLPDRPQIA